MTTGNIEDFRFKYLLNNIFSYTFNNTNITNGFVIDYY
mgnify:CR=1 FL=1